MKTRLGVRCRAGDLEGCEDESFLIKDRVEMRDEALYHHEPGLRWGQPIGGSSQRRSILSTYEHKSRSCSHFSQYFSKNKFDRASATVSSQFSKIQDRQMDGHVKQQRKKLRRRNRKRIADGFIVPQSQKLCFFSCSLFPFSRFLV